MDSIKNESNTSSDFNSNDHHQVWRWKPWSITRNEYQRIALDAYEEDDCEKAILYDSKALSCGFVGNLLHDNQFNEENESAMVNQTIDLQEKTGNVLIDYLSEYVNKVDIDYESNKTPSIPDTDDATQFNELCTKCAQLPKEWNVIQLNQLYDGYNRYATKKDMYTSDAPVRLTLFRDAMSEKRDNRPTSIVLDWIEYGEKSVSKSIEIH